MKYFRDGDQIVIVRDSFVDLQSSAALFFDVTSDMGQRVIRDGLSSLVPVVAGQMDAELYKQDMDCTGIKMAVCGTCQHIPALYEGLGLCTVGTRVIGPLSFQCALYNGGER